MKTQSIERDLVSLDRRKLVWLWKEISGIPHGCVRPGALMVSEIMSAISRQSQRQPQALSQTAHEKRH